MTFFSNSPHREIIGVSVNGEERLSIFEWRKLRIGIQNGQKCPGRLEGPDPRFQQVPRNLQRPTANLNTHGNR